MMAALRPGGLFLISAPNCNDFGKRITVPLGIAEWSSFDWWYHKPVFRSHVREPSVRDFRQIAQDLNLVNSRVYGRNDSLLLSPRLAGAWDWQAAGLPAPSQACAVH